MLTFSRAVSKKFRRKASAVGPTSIAQLDVSVGAGGAVNAASCDEQYKYYTE